MFGNTQEEVAVRVTTKGQVTIPLAIRQALGIVPGTELSFRIRGSRIEIEKAVDGGRGAEVVRRLRLAYQVAGLLAERDQPRVIQAWFQGMNPQLEDWAPARMIREGAPDDVGTRVLAAARAFASVG